MPRYRKLKVDEAGRLSGGILLWHRRHGRSEVLLGYPGSPFWRWWLAADSRRRPVTRSTTRR